MFANIAMGGLMWAVHFLSKRIPESEYGVLITLLSLTMVVPILPLQMVFAQQTAKALACGTQRQLVRMIRMSVLALVLVWMVWAGIMALFQQELIETWQITNPAAFWMALVALLGALLLPMFWGLHQGRQDFFSLGNSMILSAAGRFGGALLIVVLIAGHAAGIMSAVALGFTVAIAFSAYRTRDLWMGQGEPFNKSELLKQVVPLMLGFGAFQLMFTADTMFVRAWFPDETHAYGAAGTLSRALMWLVLPLAAVMFPKIVQSSARSQKTDLLAVTLLGTGVLAACGALGLWLVGPYVVPIVYPSSYVALATSLMPWYAGAMVPLALGNVLINNLLAKGDYRLVPLLVLLAIGFVITLKFNHASLVQVLQVLAIFNTLFLGVSIFFTWVWKPNPQTRPETSPAAT